MRTLRNLFLPAMLVLAGCSPLRVQTDYDQRTTFDHLRTFGWVQSGPANQGDPVFDSSLVHRRIQHAVNYHLSKRGFVEEATEPDFRIAARLHTRHGIQVYPTYGYGYRHFGSYHGSYAGYSSDVSSVIRGTLVLDIIDTRRNEVVFRGWASKTLLSEASPDRVHAYIDDAVEEILQRFPPEA